MVFERHSRGMEGGREVVSGSFLAGGGHPRGRFSLLVHDDVRVVSNQVGNLRGLNVCVCVCVCVGG